MFIPETIDLGQSEKYDLSIRIRPDGFMFSIADPENGKNYCLRETTFSEDSLLQNIQRIIFDLNFLTQEYRKTTVLIVSKDYNLIPDEYLIDKKKELLYNSARYQPADHVLTCKNEKEGNSTIFNIDKEIYEFLSRSLYNPTFLHHTSPLISYFGKQEKTINLTSRMLINFHDNMLDILCFSTECILLSLSYEGEATANQLYFILKLWERCGFDQQKDWLYVTGQPEEEVVEGLKKYFLHIEACNFPTETYRWNEDAQKAPTDLILLAL